MKCFPFPSPCWRRVARDRCFLTADYAVIIPLTVPKILDEQIARKLV